MTNHVVPYEIHRRRKIALQLTLLYDDFTVVRNAKEGGKSILCYNDQELQFNENVRACLAADPKGTCDLNVRIESVSKNHNSKLFVICVQPNIALYPQNADIAGGYTTPICVKSKRIAKSDSLPFPSALERSFASSEFPIPELGDKLKRTASDRPYP